MRDWKARGFARPPERRTAGRPGVVVYRCFGGGSSEWGTGYFSLEKPKSVLDAELRFNIVDWDNAVRFVSTFRIKRGFEFFVGPVAHGPGDLSREGTQVYVTPPLSTKVELLTTREILRQDVSVVVRSDKGRVDA